MENIQAAQVSAASRIGRDYYDQTPPGEIVESEDDECILFKNIQSGDVPTVAVIGVGYVGEHLIDAFSSCCDVIGYDVSSARVNKLKQENKSGAYFTNKSSVISVATHFLISVPTLLQPNQNVDSSYLRQAIAVVAKYARPGATVVIESSVAVGMTRELLGSLAKEKNSRRECHLSVSIQDELSRQPGPSPKSCLVSTTLSLAPLMQSPNSTPKLLKKLCQCRSQKWLR